MKLPEEQARGRLVRQWLHKAEIAPQAAEALLSRDPPLLYPSCFLCQQAAEKYLKALLTWHQAEFPKTHLMGALLDILATVNASLAESLAGATALNPYGVEVRYSGDRPEPTADEAAAALDLARKVRDAVRHALPEG
jgi:HEPN domain-containing protein